ncbi:MAG: AraC family transcriptional regulator [Christensenellaceae bacterium]|nr:AraC family transcriptional regulator [Christensenellaceae bacterium]
MYIINKIQTAIDYIEAHLKEDMSKDLISDLIGISGPDIENAFKVLTGYTLAEYIRNRRLSEAALDIKNSSRSMLDISLDYRYNSTASFARAFSRFHGHTASQVKKGADIRLFPPVRVRVAFQGGEPLEYRIVTMLPFRLIGYEWSVTKKNSAAEIAQIWEQFRNKNKSIIQNDCQKECFSGKNVINPEIGEYGIRIFDKEDDSRFRYVIAGIYTGGDIPEGMDVYKFQLSDWAIFSCVGSMPNAVHEIVDRIFEEWLPKNDEFELSGNTSIERYEVTGSGSAISYSALWMPIVKKPD